MKTSAIPLLQYYIVVPKSQLTKFAFASDRKFFSRPVPVEPLSCVVGTQLVRVRDMVREIEFPVPVDLLKTYLGLTNKQRAALAASERNAAASSRSV